MHPHALRRRAVRPALVLVALAALFVALLQAVGSHGAEAADTLVSQGKPITASSEGGSGYVATNANDGSTATRWASISHVDPQWIRVDLGSTMAISKVSLIWDVSCATSYKIQVSANDSTYADVFSTTTGDGATDDITVSATGRYVRMFGSVRCRDAGYSLQEFKVYSPASSTPSLLSQGRPITASSEGGSGYVAANANDGSTATRWASVSHVDPQWIRVDLGASASISKVTLIWDVSCATSYKIQVSANDSTYADVFSTTTGDGATDDITVSATGRYVRMFGSVRCRDAGYSLQEFKVFGTGGASPSASPSASTSPIPTGTGLADPRKKEIAMELVSSAENSSLNWKAQYRYIEDIHDGRGYTAGIVGFCSGTGDMLDLVQHYTDLKPGNILAKYQPALRRVNGTSSHSGLDPSFVGDWRTAAGDSVFQKAQNDERDRVYFNPAVSQAKADGLRTLGQFIYYDAIVMHGPGSDHASFGGIRAAAMKRAKTPAQGGNETTYLNAFLDVRKSVMLEEAAHDDTSRVDTEQRKFLRDGNLNLNTPLDWKTYGDSYHIS